MPKDRLHGTKYKEVFLVNENYKLNEIINLLWANSSIKSGNA